MRAVVGAVVSVIVPVLDEARAIGPLLDALAREREQLRDVVVVDGGSADGTVGIARAHPLAPRVIASPRGRGCQLNAGAREARGEVLWFVHADTSLPEGAAARVADAVERRGAECGCFGLRIESRDVRLLLGAAIITARSRATHSATGDQAIFATRALFDRVGGFPEWSLFEDLELVRRARRARARWACLDARVGTSARRWQAQGVGRTIVRMWSLRALFHAGVDPERLARFYGRDVREKRAP